MELIKPDARFEDSFLKALVEMDSDAERESWVGLGAGSKVFGRLPFSVYVEELLEVETNPPEGFVCCTTYWAVDAGEVLGRISLRHELSDSLRQVGGHIGYIVRPSSRKQGVASEMLRLLLQTEEARSIGSLLLTCDVDNEPSARTILKNGGLFESVLDLGEGLSRKKRFWIHRHEPPLALDRVSTLLFDLDGVLTKVTDRKGNFLWRRDIESDLGISQEEVSGFFRDYWGHISQGKRDTLETLAECIEKRKWPLGAKEFLSYWHEKDSNLCEEMIQSVRTLRDGGYRVFLATNQEPYRMRHMWENLGLRDVFDDAFPSCHVGFEKPERGYFEFVQAKLGQDPGSLLFVDDTPANAAAARSSGWNALDFKSPKQFHSQVFEYLTAKRGFE